MDETVDDVCASVEKDCRGGGGVHLGIKSLCELGGYVGLSTQCKSCQLRISASVTGLFTGTPVMSFVKSID